ncbi:hypothetical protein HYZ78_01160 [Candidatus Microgenomates bacterium]|nr:hypothetical protein [Candidatus Microgenomates bacterium]
MSDWEPVEPDPFVGAGGDQPSPDSPRPAEIPTQFTAEQIEKLFLEKVVRIETDDNGRIFMRRAEHIRGLDLHRVGEMRRVQFDPTRLFLVTQAETYNKDIGRSYYIFNPERQDFEFLADARFYMSGDSYATATVSKYGSRGEMLMLSIRGRDLSEMNLFLPQEEGNGAEEVIHAEYVQGKLKNIEFERIAAGQRMREVEMGMNRRPYTEELALVINKKAKISWEAKGMVYKLSRITEESEDFLYLERADGGTIAKIPLNIPTDIVEQLFPGEIFNKDPFSVDPSDDKWVQADWQTMLGGLHWEHSVPQVKDDDTQLPEGK